MQNIHSNLHQFLAHLDTIFDSKCLDSIRVIFDTVHLCLKLCWNTCLAELGHLAKSSIRIDAHETGNNRTRNAPFTTVLYKRPKNFGVKEHLGNDEIGSGIHLLLQVIHFLLVILIFAGENFSFTCRTPGLFCFGHGRGVFDFRNSIWVSLGVTSNTDSKLVSKIFSHVNDEIQGTSEPTVGSFPLVLSRCWITSQRNDIANTIFLSRFQGAVNGKLGISVLFHVGAGHVHVGNMASLTQVGGNLQSQVGG
mmetsp:Transcript_19813/g.31973  ORF Transcript_19813/g.31973 Transcript_19813/m.31973 type:complete len:251 (+) Transcript_19813:363-1115(+)